MNLSFGVLVTTDKRSGRIMSVYLQIREGKAADVHEVSDGAAFANYNRRGELLGIELLAPCHISVLTKIAREASVKRFIRNGIPQQMALAGV